MAALSLVAAKVKRVFADGKANSTQARDFGGVNLYDETGDLIATIRKKDWNG